MSGASDTTRPLPETSGDNRRSSEPERGPNWPFPLEVPKTSAPPPKGDKFNPHDAPPAPF